MHLYCLITRNTYSRVCEFLISDSTQYAHYVFKAFDVNCNGAISFKVSEYFAKSAIFIIVRSSWCTQQLI